MGKPVIEVGEDEFSEPSLFDMAMLDKKSVISVSLKYKDALIPGADDRVVYGACSEGSYLINL